MAPAANAVASGPDSPCHNHTAPHPETRHTLPPDTLARGTAAPGTSSTLPPARQAGREQRMPAILLRPRHYFPAEHRPHRLLLVLVLEHRLCLGQADLLFRRTDL